MRALLSIVAIAALAAAAPDKSEPRCNSLVTACSDLYLAIECGTVAQCIPRWENLRAPVGNDTELCATCKKMVQEARDNLLSNMTQTELREVLEGSCDDLMPIRPFNTICKKLMDTFQDELNDMLVSRMDPTQVCTVSGLCWKPDNSDIEQRASDIFLRKSAAKTCNTCRSSVSKIVGIAKFADRGDVVRGFSNACRSAGYTRPKCDEFAQTYVAKFLHHIQTSPSEKTCQFFGRCDGMSRPMTVGPADTMECEFCEAMIHKVVVQFNNTSMKEQVKTVLENICKKTGSWAAECQERIADDFDKAYDELISLLDPVNVCTLAGICNSKQSLRTLPLTRLTPARPAAPGSTAMCTICQDVAKVVQKAVNANFTQNQLVNALDLVCDVLPVVSKGNCFDFVNKNVPQLIQMFNERFTVEHICSESFKLCPAAPELRAEFREDKCEICEKAVSWVASELNATSTEDDIIKLVQEVCDTDLFPPRVKSSCRNEIEAYGSLIIHLLVKRMDPGQICTEIRLCNAPRVIKHAAPVSGAVCDECQQIANYIVEALQDDKTEQNIKNVLDQTCQSCPDKAGCKKFIDDNIDRLFELLRQDVTAAQICQTLRLCGARLAVHEKVVAKTEICDQCLQIANYIVDAIKDDKTEQNIKNVLEKTCQSCPEYASCKQFIDENIDEIFELLRKDVTAAQICQALRLCAAQTVIPAKSVVKTEICDKCLDVANRIVDAIKDDKTEQNIKNILDQTCQSCPDQAGCKKFIDDNIDQLFELLRQDVTAAQICKALRLCGSAVVMPARIIAKDELCDECLEIAGKIVDAIKDDKTEQNIKNVLDQTCKSCPDQAGCQKFIDDNIDRLFELLRQKVTADQICKALRMCGARLVIPKKTAAKAQICDQCLAVANYIVGAIENNRTEQNIKKVLDTACTICPDQEGCKQVINANIDDLFEILRKDVTPIQICEGLRLCGAQATVPKVKVAKVENCGVCSMIVDYIIDKLKGNTTDEAILETLEKVCKVLPVDQKECQNYIDVYGGYIVSLIEQNYAADAICAAIGLCKTPKPAVRTPKTVCDECQQIAGYLVSAVNDDRSEENIKAVVEKVCELIPMDVGKCQQFIDSNIDQLVQLLREEVTIDHICQTLRLCGSRAFPVPLRPKTKAKSCGLCSEVVDYLIGAIKDNSTDAEILDAVERVCKVLPFDKTECQNVINVYGQYIITMIQQDVAADVICQKIGFCAPPPPSLTSDSCQLCQMITGFVINELKDNTTDAAIIDVLERGCSLLPIDKAQCRNVVDVYGSMIVNMIQNNLTPDEICGTLRLCAAPRPKGQSCELCETVAHFLVDELKDNKTDAAILEALERVCNVLPVDKVSCQNTIDVYGKMIMDLIQQDASADEICAAIGLCSSRKVVEKAKSDFCSACKMIAGFLIDELKDNKTDAAILAALEKVCKVVPVDSVQCKNYIDVYGDMVIEMIENNLSPDQICSSIGYCAARKDLGLTDNQVCPLCEIVVHVVEAELQNNNTQKEIETALEKACSLMPQKEAQQCRNMVNVYTTYIIDMVESLATAEQICQTLGFCPVPPTPPKCEVCLFITNFVESELSDNRTETQILKLLDKACDVIPNMDVPQCKETINQFSDMIITLLLQSVPPRKICEEIKMCPLSKKTETVPAVRVPLADGEQCMFCKWLVTWVDDKLDDNRTEAVIIDELDKACDLLTDAGKCKDMVNDYVDMIVKMLIQYADPEKICEAIKKCPPKQFRKDEPPCRYCRYVIDELRGDVQKTEAELKKKLDGICRVLPVDTTSCQAFVEQYAEQIINLILSDTDPEKICEILGVCPKKIRATVTKCNFCREVMQFVVDEVKDETTDDEIVGLVARACNYVPAIHREDCQRVVEIEGLVIVRMIGESLDADSICGALKYCPEKRSADKLTCTWCQYALHFIQEKLYDNSTQQKIREELEKMCLDLPKPELSAECREFVDAYGPSLEVIIAQDLDPSIICPAIHACPARKSLSKPGRRPSSQKCHDCVSTLRSFRHNPAQICKGVTSQFATKCVGASSVGLQLVNAFDSDYKICKYAKSCSKVSGSFRCNRGGCQHVR